MEIRELSDEEIDKVNGGIGPTGAIVGGLIGGYAGYINNGWRGAAVGVVFGAASGFTGGLASVTTGFTRMAWGARSFGFGVFGSGMDTRREK